MRLSREIIHSAGTSGCGFNRDQLELLGVAWPPKQGWLYQLIDTEVPDEVWVKVLALKAVRKKRDRKRLMAAI